MDIDPRIMKIIDPDYGPDMQAAKEGKVRICRLPNETRFSAESSKGIYAFGCGIGRGPVQGTVKCGVTGPAEGVMVEFDDQDQREEVNPHWIVTPLWNG